MGVFDSISEAFEDFEDQVKGELRSDLTRGISSVATVGLSEAFHTSRDRKDAEKIVAADRALDQKNAARLAAADRAAIESSGGSQGISLSDLFENDDNDDGLLSGINA